MPDHPYEDRRSQHGYSPVIPMISNSFEESAQLSYIGPPDTALEDYNLMEEEILLMTRLLLEAITTRDWDKYQSLCSQDLSCFEPETAGSQVVGLQFHRFYFDSLHQPSRSVSQHAMLSPRVIQLGSNSACIAYTRLTQFVDIEGRHCTSKTNETRVWTRADGQNWRCIHFHKSDVADYQGPAVVPPRSSRAPHRRSTRQKSPVPSSSSSSTPSIARTSQKPRSMHESQGGQPYLSSSAVAPPSGGRRRPSRHYNHRKKKGTSKYAEVVSISEDSDNRT